MALTIIKHTIEIVGGIKLFNHIPSVCAQCLIWHLTQHTLYTTNDKYLEIVDKLKEVETMEQIHHIIHILHEWAEANEVLIHITL